MFSGAATEHHALVWGKGRRAGGNARACALPPGCGARWRAQAPVRCRGEGVARGARGGVEGGAGKTAFSRLRAHIFRSVE